MKHIKQAVIALALVLGMVGLAAPQPAAAIDLFQKSCANQGGNDVCAATKTDNATSMVKQVINTLLYIMGIVAVIVIIIGGFRYVLSSGSSAEITSAKNTILYAVIGLVVAILAYAIVNFVVGQF